MSGFDTGKLLIDDTPIAFLPRLACILGSAEEAIVLQQIHFWLNNPWDRRIEVKQHAGRAWVRIPPKAIFDPEDGRLRFLKVRTFREVLKRLKDRHEVLLTANLNGRERDTTNWYAVDYEQLSKLEKAYTAALCRNCTTRSAEIAQPGYADFAQPGVQKLHNGSADSAQRTNKSTSKEQQQEQEQPAVVDLISDLVASGVSRKTATELASSAIEESQRQLEFLPYRTGRKDKAATLVKAIREQWAPPVEWQAMQEANAATARAQSEAKGQAQRRAREKEQQQATDASNQMLDRMWQALDARKQKLLDQEARQRLGILGKMGQNQAALDAMRRTLLRERLNLVAPESE